MKVIAEIQCPLPCEHPPVDMQWYRGGDAVKAIAAVAQILSSEPCEYTRTLGVRIEFEEGDS